MAKYRGKLVLIQYWATWCEPCKQDMLAIKDSYTKHGGRGFDVIGICLDDDQMGAQQFIKENRIPWQQIYEPDGLNGRLADEMGVMTLPLMVLVDENGLVVNRNIHAAELAASDILHGVRQLGGERLLNELALEEELMILEKPMTKP